MPKTKSSAKNKKQGLLVNVILDRSGSMFANRAETIAGYNEYINGLRADGKSSYSLSLVQFDAHATGPELTVSYIDKPLAEVQDLTLETYQPRGSTPLYDAIGECVRRVEAKGRPVITVIITDGMENASIEFTKETVRKLITEKEAEGWKFVFMGANIDSYAVGGMIGVAGSATTNYSPQRSAAAFSNIAASTAAYSCAVQSHGVRGAQSMSFFTDAQRAYAGDETVAGSTGGRQAAPDPFQVQPTTSMAGKRRGTQWIVSQ